MPRDAHVSYEAAPRRSQNFFARALVSNVCAHTASHERERGLFKWLSAYAAAAAASAAIKGELRENGVGEVEARIMGEEREREGGGRERITLKGKAYFKKIRLE